MEKLQILLSQLKKINLERVEIAIEQKKYILAAILLKHIRDDSFIYENLQEQDIIVINQIIELLYKIEDESFTR